ERIRSRRVPRAARLLALGAVAEGGAVVAEKAQKVALTVEDLYLVALPLEHVDAVGGGRDGDARGVGESGRAASPAPDLLEQGPPRIEAFELLAIVQDGAALDGLEMAGEDEGVGLPGLDLDVEEDANERRLLLRPLAILDGVRDAGDGKGARQA